MAPEKPTQLRLALPKGRMQAAVLELLSDAGIEVAFGARTYRPRVSLPGVTAKLLKPQNVVEMLHFGSRDVGFCGADWVEELGAELVPLLDTGLDPVRIVAAAPRDLLRDGELPRRRLVVASELERITTSWIAERGLDAVHVRTFGATEVFPPEDADLIVDVTQTGETLAANGLEVFDDVRRSSTRLYAHPGALDDPVQRARIDRLVLLLESVLKARRRVMVELTVPRNRLEEIVSVLPCLRRPTVASLFGEDGYAVKAAVPRDALAGLIPELRRRGGSDVVVSAVAQLVP